MFALPKIPSGIFNINIGKFSLPIPYWQAIAIIVLLFLLVFMIAKFRRHYVNWSFKGAAFGILFGFVLALVLEGFLIIGGKTVLTSVLGWKNPPKPVANVLDMGRSKLIQVLGVNTTIPSSIGIEDISIQRAIEMIQNLNPADNKTFKNLICQ